MSKPAEQLPLFNAPLPHKPTLHLYCDGAARGNPGPAGIGIAIIRGKETLFGDGFAVGTKTNNQAEYLAFIVALIIAREHRAAHESILVHSDSELLVQQINGSYRVRNQALQKLFATAYVLCKSMPVRITHIARASNDIADALANRGIDMQTAVPDNYKQVLHDYQITL